MLKRTPLVNAISCAIAASALGVSSLALAQDVPEAEVTDEVIEEVIVTGSRIRRDSFSSSTPVDVINTDISGIQGVADIGTLLQGTTIAAGSSQITPAISSAFVTNGGVGSQTLSLRGLGANRTLTLLNGRRAGPAGTRGGVSAFDLNVLPLAAIERVEILKDGASSIYGSDAVAGVVNIITKTNEGGTLEAYIGIPTESGGEETRVSGRFGKDYEKGRFSVTADYHKIKELKNGDRDYLACPEMYIFDEETGERADAFDTRTNSYSCRDSIWGHVWIYDYQDPGGNVPSGAKAQYIYGDDPSLYPPSFNDSAAPGDPYAMRTPPGWYPVSYDKASDGITNYDHPFQDETSFYPETETMTLFADGEYSLSENVDMYAELLLNRRETKVNGYRQFWGYIYNYNYFYGNTLHEEWTGAQWMSPTPITDHSDTSVKVDYTRYVVGLRGAFSENWDWDLSYQYSKSDGSYTEDQIYNDSVEDQNWLGGSCEGMVTSVRGVPCQDIPWLDPQFLAGDVDPAMRDFLFGSETGNTEYVQWSVEGYTTGDLFEMPAGTVASAIGFQYRDDKINDTPGEITLAGNGWGTTSAGITKGSDTTKAIFAEIDMPLLADKKGVKYLALNMSGRYTDVDSYGGDFTYKVGINWQITDSFRFRASQGTSFRTPALYELYLADQTSFINQRFIDPCIRWGDNLEAGNISQRVANNCSATTTDTYPDGIPPDFTGGTITAEVITGGGFGVLDAETSLSRTAGIIWQPEFANLSVSIDYFDIQVDNQVDQLGAGGIVGGCYNSEFWPSDPLCDLFDRSGLNSGIDNVRDSFINVATQTNSGWDFALKYIVDAWDGELSFDTQFTLQDEASTALFADTVRDNNGEFGEPEWVGRLWTNYSKGNWSYYWGIDFIGDVSNVKDFGGDTTTYRGEDVRVVIDADWVAYNSFSVTRHFTQKGVRATLGIRNAFGEDPPRVTTLSLGQLSTAGNSAFYSQYDYLGRRFFLNVAWDFF
jgi:iron complex outermembrane receptor protein